MLRIIIQSAPHQLRKQIIVRDHNIHADTQEHTDQQLKTEQTNQTSLKEKQFPQEETSIVFPERKNPPPESDS